MSQTTDILEALKHGAEITPLEALRDYGCMRLGARIWELKQQGHKIRTDLVEVNGKTVARYRMVA